jgi:hypothetical protein
MIVKMIGNEICLVLKHVFVCLDVTTWQPSQTMWPLALLLVLSQNPLQDGMHIYDFAIFRLKRKKRLYLD